MVTWAFIFTHGDFTLKQKARRWGQLEVMTSPDLLSARQGERLVNTPDRATLVWLEPGEKGTQLRKRPPPVGLWTSLWIFS